MDKNGIIILLPIAVKFGRRVFLRNRSMPYLLSCQTS